MRSLLVALFMVIFFPHFALGDVVVPSERVTNHVTIRAQASSLSQKIGQLRVGDAFTFVQSVPRWHEIQLPNSTQTGFVPKSWTRRVEVAIPETDPMALPSRQQDELRIHYLPMGAGTCTVVECPGANAPPMIIDCGSKGKGSKGLKKEAATKEIQRILALHPGTRPNLVLSHSDKDHVNYLATALENVSLGHVWQGDNSPEYEFGVPEFLTNQENDGAVLHQDNDAGFHHNGQPLGNDLSCGDADTFILTTNSGSTDNARSLVLMIEYQDFTAIFPGDAEGVTESQARANFNDNVHATVLAGSHHGAKTHSSNGETWADATSPNVMIYSSGTQHGHPWCIATERYEDTLSQTEHHNMQCGISTKYDERRQFTTSRAEYVTEISGKIVVTTNGQSPLHLGCTHGSGCDVEIQY